MVNMDASQIRTLILSIPWVQSPNFSVPNVADSVISRAVEKGILDRKPQALAEEALKNNMSDVIWGLIIEGVFAPGTGWQNGNLPFLRITEYGKKCFEAGETTP